MECRIFQSYILNPTYDNGVWAVFHIGVVMTEAQEVYQGLMLEVLKLRKRLQEKRIKNVLAKLASTKFHPAHVRHLAADFEDHVDRVVRDNDAIDNLLEILEDLL